MRFPATTEGHINLTSFSNFFEKLENFVKIFFLETGRVRFIFVPFRVVCDKNPVSVLGPKTKIQFRNQYESPPIFISDTFVSDTFLKLKTEHRSTKRIQNLLQ